MEMEKSPKPQPRRMMMVNLIGHCSICLRKMNMMTWTGDTSPEDKHHSEAPVPEGRLPPELTYFGHIWSYLVEKGKYEDLARAKFICSGGAGNGDAADIRISDLPPICEACGVKVTQLDRLHRELEALVQEIKKVISGGGGAHCLRRQGFGELLRNSQLEPGALRDTFQFLEQISGTVIEWMDMDDANTSDNLKSESCAPNDFQELEQDDWKLRASAVVSIRRRGPSRKVNVPFFPQEDLPDHVPDSDIKQEAVEPGMDAFNEDDPGFPNDLFLNPTDADGDIKSEMDTEAPRRPPKGGRFRGRRPPKRGWSKKKKVSQRPNECSETKTGMKWNHAICEICNASIPIPDMYSHIQTHVGEFTVRCPNPKCSRAYSNPRSLERLHIRRTKACQAVANKLGKVCETCGASYESAVALRAHVLLHETASKNVTCPIQDCGERFTVRQSVYPHIYQKHLGAKTVQQCSLCKKFQDVKEMESHLKDQHEIQTPINCRECSYVFPEWEPLLAHLPRHQSEGGIPCYICTTGEKFPNVGKLSSHYYKEHGIGKQFVCDLCGKEYAYLSALQMHIKIIHEGHQRKLQTFTCDLCPEGEGPASGYRTEKDLVSHKIRAHGAEPFACDTCHATFHNREDLKWHLRNRDPLAAEEGICTKPKREWPCDVDNCSSIYYSRRGLDVHKRRDHGIVGPRCKPLICEFCQKEFGTASVLLKHRKQVHLGIRMTKECVCETCGEKFVSIYNLKRHELIHKNERPHACEFCGQTFRQKGVLDTHLKSHETLGDKFKPKGPIERTKRFKREPKGGLT